MVDVNVIVLDEEAWVADFWQHDHGWHWEKFRDVLPQHVLDKLDLYNLTNSSTETDGWCWTKEASGKLSVTSAFSVMANEDMCVQDSSWQRIWKLKVPRKMSMFLWLVRHRRIMCNMERCKRGFTLGDRCPLCNQPGEDVEHVVRRCTFAFDVWKRLLPESEMSKFTSSPFDLWLDKNIKGSFSSIHATNWPTLFAITVWWIWRWRNDVIFNGSHVCLRRKIVALLSYEAQVRAAMRTDRVMTHSSVHPVARTGGWHGDEKDAFVLNVDAALGDGRRPAGCDGVLRDSNGVWRGGFACTYPAQLVAECET